MDVIMGYGIQLGIILVRCEGLKLKCLNDGFVYYKHTAFCGCGLLRADPPYNNMQSE